MLHRTAQFAGLMIGLVVPTLAVNQLAAADPPGIDFSRDIRPILSDHCFACHGPDEGKLEAELRLDTRDGLFRESDDMRVVVPGEPKRSEMFRRISSTDPDEHMPPAKFGRPLKPEQIELIRRWIDSGAEWKQHWSFVVPQRAADPNVSQPDWASNSIDHFILARLDREGLQPSPKTDRRTLLRRVTRDLTGLPPTPEEIDAFLADRSPKAYENVVDQLLKSPRYAERMAIRWLDYARYADTSGYQSDGPRDMWRWRDWVINAFHNNKPFDEFTIEQLAGDLLSVKPALDADFETQQQWRNLRIATAFNRNHRGNAEGGIVPEEFQVEYVVDRVDTTFAVWQGLTMGCARCHSHKYDPISQDEYYSAFAYFNNIPENGRAMKEGNSPPWMRAPTDGQLHEIRRSESQLQRVNKQTLKIVNDRLSKVNYRRWRQAIGQHLSANKLNDLTITNGLVAHFALDGSLDNTALKQSDKKDERADPAAKIVESSGEPFAKGRHGRALHCDGERFAELGDVAKFGYMERFSLGARVFLERHSSGTIVSRMEHVDRGAGYNLHVTDSGTVQLNLVKRWLDDSLRVESVKPLPVGRWVHVFATYDGSRVSGWDNSSDLSIHDAPDWQQRVGITIYFDGEEVAKKANLDGINQTFANDEPLRIGSGMTRFHGLIDDVRIYNRHLVRDEVNVLAAEKTIAELHEHFDDPINDALFDTPGGWKYRYFGNYLAGPPDEVALFRKQRSLIQKVQEWHTSVPRLMIMEELAQPRDTHVLIRGQYDKPGALVEAGVPSALPPLPEDAPPNRLGFASWLVSGDNPLTARVTVNRFWRDIFGTGLVKTAEDFGVQGARPSHPQLLDWLAVEFVESGWDVKHVIKTIVMSSTYRQSSRATKELHSRDPVNRLLARGPRYRLPAEMIRDQALHVSGLLTDKLGGPSVRPYQPAGLWEEIATDKVYELSKGPDLYRRSIYTYWKRTVSPPMMSNFDASGREACQIGMTRTNTPLQALNLLNDVTFVEAARVLAQSLLAIDSKDSERLESAYVRILGRPPAEVESLILLASLTEYRKNFEQNAEAASLLIATGESQQVDGLSHSELAAWTTVCSTILNLDEAVTRE
jgi:mono/diheme cytochrome c family protein